MKVLGRQKLLHIENSNTAHVFHDFMTAPDVYLFLNAKRQPLRAAARQRMVLDKTISPTHSLVHT